MLMNNNFCWTSKIITLKVVSKGDFLLINNIKTFSMSVHAYYTFTLIGIDRYVFIHIVLAVNW